jgi:hypothetical protein
LYRVDLATCPDAPCSPTVSPSDSGLKPLGPFKRAPSILASAPWRPDGCDGLPRRLPLQTTGGGPSRVAHTASVGRLCAGQLALHMAPTVRGCGASAASPSDSESRPKPLGSFKRVSEGMGVTSMARCASPELALIEARTSSTPAIHPRVWQTTRRATFSHHSWRPSPGWPALATQRPPPKERRCRHARQHAALDSVGSFGAACCASVDRHCAGQLALHMASTVRGCGTSATLPSDSGPKLLGPFKCMP